MAQWRNTIQTYGIIARTFHWVMAVMVIGMLAVGFYMAGMAMGPDKIQIYGWHKATGILVLGLVTLRLLWRWSNKAPALPGNLSTIQRLLAHLSHFGLYGLMFGMPLVGWAMSSAAGIPVSVFGWFTLPPLLEADKGVLTLTKILHYYGGLAFVALIGLHFLAALYHHFIRGDNVLRRMLPW